jgi:hypothetical protein
MKPGLTFLFALLSIVYLSAQIEWVSNGNAFYAGLDYQQRLVRIIDGGFAINAGDVFTVDSLGSQIHQYNRTSGFSRSTPFDIRRLPGGWPLIAEDWSYPEHSGTDYIKFDSLWNDQVASDCWCYQRNVRIFSDTSYLFYDSWGASMIQRADSFIYINSENFNIRDILITPLDTVIVATDEGLHIRDHNFDLVYAIFSPAYDHITINENTGGYIATVEDRLFLLDPHYQITQQTDYGGEKILSVDTDSEKLAILTESKRVYLYEHPLVPYSEFTPQETSTFYNIALNEGQLILSGLERFGAPGGIHNAFIKSYSLQGNTVNHGQDASLTDISFEVTRTRAPHPETFDTLHRLSFSNLKIKIKNNGSQKLNSITLGAHFPSYTLYNTWNWPGWFRQNPKKAFNNLDLEPGESKVLNWQGLKAWFDNAPSSPYQLCIWAANPNGRLDNNGNNEYVCASQPIVVALEEPTFASDFKVFPNPVEHLLTVQYTNQTPNNIIKLEIQNALGQSICKEILSTAHKEVSTSNWSKGIYWLSITLDAEIIYTQRLVKQ